jgi:hypothetical protein
VDDNAARDREVAGRRAEGTGHHRPRVDLVDDQPSMESKQLQRQQVADFGKI